jgi:hypothetical protein
MNSETKPQENGANPSAKSWFMSFLRKHFEIRKEVNFWLFKLKGNTTLGWILICIMSVALLAIPSIFGYQLLRLKNIMAKRVPSIVVFRPDPKQCSEGAFYQDGVVQDSGFTTALENTIGLPGRLDVKFYSMGLGDSPKRLLEVMQKYYSDSGGTYFIMTMSSKVYDTRQLFKEWHNQCISSGLTEPILIATVASAPEIADDRGGILRWYIRSEEESTLLAEYLSWKSNVCRAGVFYITKTPTQDDDPYGVRGMEVFRDRFYQLGGKSIDWYRGTGTTAKSNVEEFLAKYRKICGNDLEGVGVFIVGYGKMVKATIGELLAQRFNGPIACSSTLTEPDWQPEDTRLDSKIVTVLPRLSDPQGQLSTDDRNVVFFFAKQTLTRVLTLTADSADPRIFIDRWRYGQHVTKLDQEYLANGDTHVNLEVVGSDKWRRAKQ